MRNFTASQNKDRNTTERVTSFYYTQSEPMTSKNHN